MRIPYDVHAVHFARGLIHGYVARAWAGFVVYLRGVWKELCSVLSYGTDQDKNVAVRRLYEAKNKAWFVWGNSLLFQKPYVCDMLLEGIDLHNYTQFRFPMSLQLTCYYHTRRGRRIFRLRRPLSHSGVE